MTGGKSKHHKRKSDEGETPQFLSQAFNSMCTIIVMKHHYWERYYSVASSEKLPEIKYSEYAEAIEKELILHIGTGYKLQCERSIFTKDHFDFILTCSHVMKAASASIIHESKQQDTKEWKFDENWFKATFAAFKVEKKILLVVS